ncbi:tRNA pseudouridine(55) synthase TruB [Pseudoxanthomonas mexicana]|uniref:tRNA pseudouridine(55) synthase TruB n=1 Tax=Pseudoxanthomonas mexicana TaxID=128785 RepID=UPI000785ECF9|nr:tRNA pseudouridine(55) synthase TruB [Pseudoxanthomonas mexicana]
MSLPKLKFRPLDGLLLLDKPQGMSSNAALQVARRLFRAEKGGHTGSLDPLATGLLPLCFGEATKIAGLLLGSGKAYDTVAVLGTTTDTDDAEGAPLRERAVPPLDVASLEAALASLKGRIRQRAPIYSALKQGGEPLYTKARRGDVIEAPERDVEVHGIEILDIASGQLSLRVQCGSGTYVRSLVRDLGEALGCGAHVGALRRLWVDPFRQPRMYTLEALQTLAEQGGEAALDACLLPIEAGLAGFPRVDVDAVGVRRLAQGQRLPGHSVSDGPVAVHGPEGRVVGLGTVAADGTLSPQRLFAWAVAGTTVKAEKSQ